MAREHDRSDALDDQATAAKVADLRTELDNTRHEIDLTLAEIEEGLAPDKVVDRLSDRVREATASWREQPMKETRALANDGLTRLREMAWMNPAGLGMAATIVGFLLGRRAARPRHPFSAP